MATKKKIYQSNKKKSKLKIIRDSILHFNAVFLEKSRRFLRKLSAAFKKGFVKIQSMPRTLRIVMIYALSVILALSIFYWRASHLRVSEPPLAEPPFDWSVYLPGEPLESMVDQEGEHETIPSDENSETNESKPEDAAVSVDVFKKGDWPVRGDLFYGFHETVIQTGLGYPLYYTSKGIAIKAESGTRVLASWDGTVIKVMELDKPHGKSVMIEHNNGLVSYYGALQTVTVSVGEMVKQGQPFGMVGPGFESEPEYLYLEILKDGRVVNPVEYLLP